MFVFRNFFKILVPLVLVAGLAHAQQEPNVLYTVHSADMPLEREKYQPRSADYAHPETIKFGANSYVLNELPTEDPFMRQQYQELDEAGKIKFQQRRRFLLKSFGWVLWGVQYGYGVGAVTLGGALGTGKLVFKRYFMHDTDYRPEMKSFLKIPEMNRTMIVNGLRGFDVTIAQNLKAVAEMNEGGVNLEVSTGALAGVENKGTGRLQSIGINIGYNIEMKSMIFQINQVDEKYRSAIGAIAIGMAIGKGSIYAARYKTEDFRKSQVGESYFPPLVYMSKLGNKTYIGASQGFSIPPFVADAATYSLSTEERPVLRIMFSPVSLKFIRIQSDRQMVKASATSVGSALLNLFLAIRKVPALAWKVLNYPIEPSSITKGGGYAKKSFDIAYDDLSTLIGKLRRLGVDSALSATTRPRQCSAIFLE